MAAGGRDLQRPAGMLLPPDQSQIQPLRGRPLRELPRPRLNRDLPFEKSYRLSQISHRISGQALHKCRLRGHRLRDHQPGQARLPGRQGHRQRPPHRPQLPVQGKLPVESKPLGAGRWDHLGGHQHRHRQRQIQPRPFLFKVRRGQVGGDLGAREGEPYVADGRSYPLPGLGYLLFRKAHNRKAREARPHIALHLHQLRLHPKWGAANHLGEHPRPETPPARD